MFTKTLETAFSAMACLAESYDGGRTVLTADRIAADRNLTRPYVAKVLTALARHGLVRGKPGRGGGFSLGLPPDRIRLSQIAEAVGYVSSLGCCPFGPRYSGERGHQCPLHHEVCALMDQFAAFLESNTLAGFCRDGGDTSSGGQKCP